MNDESSAPETSLLVVDDEDSSRRLVKAILEGAGYRVTTASGGEDALTLAESGSFASIITDLNMPGMDGGELLRSLNQRVPGVPVLILTAFGSIESAVEQMRHGAYDYLRKPFEPADLVFRVQKAVEKFRLETELRSLRDTIARRDGGAIIAGSSPGVRRMLSQIEMVAPTDVPVLIRGESGTGKELAARAIHAGSARASGRFVPFNCGAIPDTLFEDELFGHVRGAFTGAVADRSGLFEEANGGTLFLDEIGDLSPPAQVKLLRAIQEGEIRRIGDSRSRRVDVRILSATHRDLNDLVSRGVFREDLFYRIAVFPLEVPPLRERKEDILLLADRFLRRCAQELNKPLSGFTRQAADRLIAYAWPGNVRELENKIRQAAVLSREGEVGAEALLLDPKTFASDEASLHQARSRFERDFLVRLITRNRGNVSAAAREAGKHRTEFYELMKRHDIRPEDYR